MTPKRMNKEHFPHWPAGLPHTLTTPQTTLVANLDISALRYPEKIALVFFGKKISLTERSKRRLIYSQAICSSVALSAVTACSCRCKTARNS
jgi:hypothetical protein